MNIKKFTPEELKQHKKEYDLQYMKNRYKNDEQYREVTKAKARLNYIHRKFKAWVQSGRDPSNFFYKGVGYEF